MRHGEWDDSAAPETTRIGLAGVCLAAARALPLAALVFGGLALLLLVRLVERPVHGVDRPWSPRITRGVCRGALRIIGLPCSRHGTPIAGAGAMVANHVSWLDIFVLNAGAEVYFVSKSEVARWPGIGWLARATGTVFIDRRRGAAGRHRDLIRDRLAAGHHLLLFPEGTSTDGMQVLRFKSSLFAAFLDAEGTDALPIQPVSLRYVAPSDTDPRLYGWWGDMGFGPHLVRTLARARQGRAEVIYHPPVDAGSYADRKALAAELGETVREGFERLSPERQRS